MDYEKLHKDTLERLQQRVREGKMTEEVAKYICPDFVAESEDERIRKAILALVKKMAIFMYAGTLWSILSAPLSARRRH